MKLEHPLIGMVIRKCVFLTFANKDIILCWVASNVGIRNKETADSAIKSALDLPRVKVGELYTKRWIFFVELSGRILAAMFWLVDTGFNRIFADLHLIKLLHIAIRK